MPQNKQTINHQRRQVLRGAGGFTLALPFLPSLATRRAYGADPVYVAKKRFVGIGTDHGDVMGPSMFPADTTLRLTSTSGTRHTVRQGKLGIYQPSSARAELSPVLSASPYDFHSRLAGKMNVLRGLDVPFYLGHHTGGFLGNYAASNYASSVTPFPTIDQVMAWSPSVYKSLTPKMRSMAPSPLSPACISYGRLNPSSLASNVAAMDVHSNPSTLFERLFGAPRPDTTRVSVVDRVLQNYNSLRQRNVRLSEGDKARLEAHMTYLSELQNRLYKDSSSARIHYLGAGIPLSCSNVPVQPTAITWEEVGSLEQRLQLCNQIVTVAFSCDATRLATSGLGDATLVSGLTTSYHEAVHMGDQDAVVRNNQLIFEKSFLNLITQLDDVDDGNGRSLLDNSLVVWTHESGQQTHLNISAPVITAGSAGGFLKTGNYCDYRNAVGEPIGGPQQRKEFRGITHRRWLATALQAMGVSPSEFERNGAKGYGTTYTESAYDLSRDSELLPFIT